MKIIALIPARGGSKGVPRKNILDINGIPLIGYSIKAGLEALEQGILDRLIVSTDDAEIAGIAQKFGADVPFLRPESLACDTAKSVDVMIHAYDYLAANGEVYDAILLLQPTCPLRTCGDIKAAVEIYKKSGVTSLISAYKEEYVCDLVSYHKQGDIAIPLNNKHNKGIRRQELDDVYVRNGAIYITDTKFMKMSRLIMDDYPAIYVMPKNRSVNIDCMDDVEELRWILSK